MPASICDPVSSALRLSLTADDSQQKSSVLDNRIYSSAKSVLLSKIEFEESGDYQSNVLDGLKSKYVVIRQKQPVLDGKFIKKDVSALPLSSENKKEDGLPKPKRTLYPVELVQLGWQNAWAAGAGMHNVGNTCYLNSSLQALFHVPAFANWLVSESSHADSCNKQDACVICGMRACLMSTQKSGGVPIKPWQVYSKLRIICRHLTPGRQEDAHEFLRYLVEAMEKCYLSRFVNHDKLDQYSKETTPLNQILGGYLRSTVRCLACQHLSTTYQHFQDLLLDIRKHSTLDEALDSFFSRERLEDFGYKCEACNKKVSATKQFFIERAPMVLCIALKRFSLAGGKLSKHVQFRKKISLTKYSFNKNTQQQLSYKFVSMVTHLGPSQNCGHYTAIGQAPNSNYYQFDDSYVRPLPLSAVLGTNAYIMFFEREITEEHCAPSTSNKVYGPQLPDHFINKEKSPLKTMFFRNDERKKEERNNKPEIKPIILNSTLNKNTEENKNSEPWVVKRNGEVEKVTSMTKLVTVTDKKSDDQNKVFSIKRPVEESRSKLVKNDGEKGPIKLMRPPKTPLQQLEDQMNKKGSPSKLVPYDSESSGDEGSKRNDAKHDETQPNRKVWTPIPARCISPQTVVTTKKHAWTVSQENSGPFSPSTNSVTAKTLNKSILKDKEGTNGKNSTEANDSPNTSVSTLSPASDHGPRESPTPCPNTSLLSSHDTLRSLQMQSHNGYGAQVNTWNGTHSQINRQVFEDRREERKRAFEGTDDMDRGRIKKVKKFHHYNKNRNGYNPFQDKQNNQNWGGSNGFNKYRNNRRPQNRFHNNKHYKYKKFNNNNRYNKSGGGSNHYSRYH